VLRSTRLGPRSLNEFLQSLLEGSWDRFFENNSTNNLELRHTLLGRNARAEEKPSETAFSQSLTGQSETPAFDESVDDSKAASSVVFWGLLNSCELLMFPAF
jgi:hypothetical protein